MADVNVGLRRFENGGTITITESGTKVIRNVEAGSLRWKPAMRERLEHKERGIQQRPMEGDWLLGEMDIVVRCAKYVANDLYDTLMIAGTDGFVNQLDSVVVFIPNYTGTANGETWTASSAWLAEQPEHQTGTEFDTLSFKLKCVAGPTPAVVS